MNKEGNKSNYILEFNSFKLGSSNKWCPKVLVRDVIADRAFPLLWDVALDSNEDANEFAYNKINEYIETNSNKKTS